MLTELVSGMVFVGQITAVASLPVIAWQRAILLWPHVILGAEGHEGWFPCGKQNGNRH
jgi:hypothetical protein